MDVDLAVGRRLRARRRLLGFTQQRVADACGVSFQQIQKYESAASRLSARTLWTLAQTLDVDIGYFFEELPREADGDRHASRAMRVGDLHPNF